MQCCVIQLSVNIFVNVNMQIACTMRIYIIFHCSLQFLIVSAIIHVKYKLKEVHVKCIVHV